LTKLRLRLLDLTSRNRLLNFKHSPGKSLQFVLSSPDKVFTKLLSNQGAAISVNPVPEPERERWTQQGGRLARPDVKEYAKQRGINTSYELMPDGNVEGSAVQSLYYPDDLARHCRKLAREARSAIEETGANMLFLVVGFLEFPDREANDRMLLAPLISVPVALEKTRVDRATGQECFTLKYTGEDLADNLSLREKLTQEYSFELPAFDDEAGPETYFQVLERLIQRKPRWKVRRHMTLALLSFSKMLLVRDIDPQKWPVTEDGLSALMDHEIVRMVFEGAPNDGGNTSPIASEYEIDTHPLLNIPLIYDADSSQHSALIDALSGRNLVVEGPPGTGKSQTITNLIAAALADGKSVLFVSEKLAALEVVKKRLAHAGLAHFCLELHSNKTQKKHVLEELQKRRDANFSAPPGLSSKLTTLEERRMHLAAYADLLNGVHGNACGLTVHQVLWRAERFRQACGDSWGAAQELYVSDAPLSDEAAFRSLSDALARVTNQYREVGGYGPEHPYWGLFVEEMLPGADLQIERTLQEFLPRFETLAKTFEDAATFLNSGPLHTSVASAAALSNLLSALVPGNPDQMAHDMLPRIFAVGDPDGQRAQATLQAFREKLAHIGTLRTSIGTRLLAPGSITDAEGVRATELQATLEGLGVLPQSAQQLQELRKELIVAIGAASAALSRVEAIGAAAGQPYHGDAVSLNKIVAVIESASTAPRDLLGFRHAAMGRPDALQLIQRARAEYDALSRETAELGELFYLDTIQDATEIGTPIAVLREGNTWYRIFQKRWRVACAAHRTLDKTKAKKPPEQRLRELERLHGLLRTSKQWKESAEYRAVLGPFWSTDEPDLDSALRLTQWHAEARFRLVSAELESAASGVLQTDEGRLAKLGAVHDDLKSAVAALDHLRSTLQSNFGGAPALGPQLHACAREQERIDVANGIERQLASAVTTLTAWAPATLSAAEVLRAVSARVELPTATTALDEDEHARHFIGSLYLGPDTDLGPAFAALAYGRKVLKARLPLPLMRVLLSATVADNHSALCMYMAEIQQGWQAIDQFDARLCKFGSFSLEAWAGSKPNAPQFVPNLVTHTSTAVAEREALLPWVQYLQATARARERGLGDYVQLLETKAVGPAQLVSAFGYRFFGSIAHAIFTGHSELTRFAGATHEQVRSEYAKLDREIIALRGIECAHKAAGQSKPPAGGRSALVGEKTEMELINHMVSHPRARVTLRRMLSQAGSAVQALKPCFMMGPQAVAQYLEPAAAQFDLVIMDEASQLKPEEALGAIARGKQLIVVGDPKQLPPTTFFDRLGTTTDDGDDGAQAAAVDSESILDVCMGHFRPVRTLRWHYRSRHESLIAFSNSRFYGNRLIVFPSPYGKNKRLGLRYRYISGAVYESQTNRLEAARVVDAAIDHMLNHPEDSLGIVTLNLRQRDLVEELLDQRCRNLPKTDEFRSAWESEGFGLFVKNLESVQGDERDVVFISTTFGPAPNTDVVRQNFGPISRQTGWRRLNVLFTRARKSVHLFSSMQPEDIVVDESTPLGTKVLREYLEFARSGVLAEVGPTGLDAESDFELSVTEVLKDAGYSVVPQLGVAGFRLDLAVKHPAYQSAYLAAIECDGASYHSGVSVRDRDRIRQEILESLGWNGRIWRIWSTDWFRNPQHETKRMVAFLKDLADKPVVDAYVDEPEVVEEEPAAVPAPRTRPLDIPTFTLQKSPRMVIEARPSQASLELAEATVIVEEDENADLEIEVGDLVTYAPLATPDQEIVMRIVTGRSDFERGLISEATPLAQALLGAMVGNDVVLRVPGKAPTSFVVKKIVRPQLD